MRRGAGAHELPLDIGSRAREYVARFEQAGRIASQYGIRVSIAYSLDAGLADVKMDACSDTMLRNGARAFFGHVGRPPEVPLQHWDFMDETR